MSRGRASNYTEGTSSPASQFDKIAFLYDELMSGVPYRSWVAYVHRILERFDCHPGTVLDLCCGTGSMSLLLAEEGRRVAGADISPAMIALARRRADEVGLPVDYYVQDASSLRLGRRFDLVLSLFDSLNYILESSALQEAFYRISEHLEPGGLLVFDMNTDVALAIGLFDQSNIGSKSSLIYDWRSSYDPMARICRIQMDFRYRRGGAEKRVEVVHHQRAYDEEEIVEMLSSAGLPTLGVYHAYTFRKATKRSDRVFFVARK
ncbi:MAG TPA: methyltransferase domain-containing protein [Armatimonadota bacterium]|nr:methyltransferase domain-containing protein [Armatimonadota bacterium]